MRNTQIKKKKKKKKKKPKPNIHCKSLNQKPQTTKSDITKANLKTKTSTEQCSQHCNTTQQTDQASLHRRSVSEHNSSSSPEHIASGFKHWRSLTGLDQRSLIGHVARSVAHRLARSCRLLRRSSLAPSLVACSVARYLSFGLLRCSLNLNLKVFHNFSLFFSLTLSVALSLSKKWKWKWNLKWNEWQNESLSLF